MRGNGEKAGENDSDAVARRYNVHREFLSRRRDVFAHAVVSVDVGESALQSFDEDREKNEGDTRGEQINRLEQEETRDERLHHRHDPSALDLEEIYGRSRREHAELVRDLIPAVLLGFG